jgi:glycosyltransferase involved in cell wall biosynthesis
LEADKRFAFDMVHHVSYATLLGASFMWRLGKPFVFGPVGGGQTAPPSFLPYFGSFRRSEVLRTFFIKYLWRVDWPAIRCARAAAPVLASNRETSALARRMGASRVEALPDVYLPDEAIPAAPAIRRPRSGVRVLWVGRMLARKGLELTVEAFNIVPASVPVELEIVGDGPIETEFRAWLRGLHAVHPVNLAGRIPWSDVHQAYDEADIFILTSLRDTCPAQLLEAMAHALPVITLDHQGAADLVPHDAGIKVPVTSLIETRRAIARAIEQLALSAEMRASMGAAGHARAQDFTRSKRMLEIEAVYDSALARHVSRG